MKNKSTMTSGFTRGTNTSLLGENPVFFDPFIHPDLLPVRRFVALNSSQLHGLLTNLIGGIYTNYSALLFVDISTNGV